MPSCALFRTERPDESTPRRMTRADHPNGTCRIAKAAGRIEADLLVNVQGDEPEIDPAHIDTLAE